MEARQDMEQRAQARRQMADSRVRMLVDMGIVADLDRRRPANRLAASHAHLSTTVSAIALEAHRRAGLFASRAEGAPAGRFATAYRPTGAAAG